MKFEYLGSGFFHQCGATGSANTLPLVVESERRSKKEQEGTKVENVGFKRKILHR